MDNDVSAGSTGSTTVIAGRLALGVTLLAFGLGYTDLIDGVTAADAVSIAHYVGGVALFVAGLLALRDRDSATGTAYTVLGAFWFTWAVSSGAQVSDNAAGLFLLLFALVALSLTLAGGEPLAQGAHGLFFVSLVLLAVARFADSDSLTKAGGWFAVAAGAVAWYAATAALAHWPTAFSRRAARPGVTATG
ncbi:GPR1/FUN34/YaaH family transporter [Streptomyces sp. NBC_01275]|uniref:GPR1/FUN34/YaaH family transporter n=1 Tax=Streptomyces sp. NBC_01275 TaxID=2903807 RepID=UPI00224DE2E8|nr:GPR1/FUN34/YaaH family transporter [Streptomyces sp. NBC_01275]MCX4762349.1 GPR1/FUN34/YaaH family transporter [Streptomyces sp. NBC_01275]